VVATNIFTGSPNAITVSNGKNRRNKNDFNDLFIKLIGLLIIDILLSTMDALNTMLNVQYSMLNIQ
jgi:hypothetical protein